MDRMYDKAAEMQIYVYETIGQLEIHVYNLLEKKNNKLGYIIYLPK